MQRLFRALIFFSTLGLLPAAADEWVSEQYQCALTIPVSESWVPGRQQQLPVGEIIYHSNFAQNNESIIVIVVPNVPTSDMSSQAFVKNMGEVLTSIGFAPEIYTTRVWLERPSGQFIAWRKDAVFGSSVGVARATVRERNLYIVMAYGKGESDRAEDKRFTRVMDTFHFIEKSPAQAAVQSELPAAHYRNGAIACAAAAVLLAALFCAVMFVSARRMQESA